MSSSARKQIQSAFVILVLLAPRPANADSDDLRATVTQAIRQLSEPSRADRIAAEKKLLSLGPDILPLLPAPDLLPTASVRQAVRRVRVQLEHDAAELSLEPSTVTLTGDFSLEELVEHIEQQTGNVVSLKGLSQDNRSLSFITDFQATPFWAVIDHIEQSGFVAAFDDVTGELTLRVSANENEATTSTTDRAFRIEGLPVTSRRTGVASETLHTSRVRILCEPRLRPLFLRYNSDTFQLLPSGSSDGLKPFNSGASIEVPLGDGGRVAEVSLSFLANNGAVQTGTLKGQSHLLVAAREQPIAFRNIGESKGVSRRRAGVTVIVNKVGFEDSRPASHNARIQLRVSYDLGANAFESHQTWVFHNRVYLIDPEGNQHAPNGGFSTLFQGDGSVGVEYRFEKLASAPADWKFVYVAPTLLVNVPLTIDLAGLPITEPNRQD